VNNQSLSLKRKRGRPRIEKPLGDITSRYASASASIEPSGDHYIMRVSNKWPNQIASAMADMHAFEQILKRGLLIKLETPARG